MNPNPIEASLRYADGSKEFIDILERNTRPGGVWFDDPPEIIYNHAVAAGFKGFVEGGELSVELSPGITLSIVTFEGAYLEIGDTSEEGVVSSPVNGRTWNGDWGGTLDDLEEYWINVSLLRDEGNFGSRGASLRYARPAGTFRIEDLSEVILGGYDPDVETEESAAAYDVFEAFLHDMSQKGILDDIDLFNIDYSPWYPSDMPASVMDRAVADLLDWFQAEWYA